MTNHTHVPFPQPCRTQCKQTFTCKRKKKKKKKSILYNKLKPNKNWISSLREKLAARYEQLCHRTKTRSRITFYDLVLKVMQYQFPLILFTGAGTKREQIPPLDVETARFWKHWQDQKYCCGHSWKYDLPQPPT